MDTLTAKQRSERMSRIRGKDMKPELSVRRLVHGMGFRYRLHAADLPGKPDLVFRSRKKVIFVHGCFWHRHADCKLARIPKSRKEFWVAKLEGNKRRDENNLSKLRKAGWSVLVVWECWLDNASLIRTRIADFLQGSI